ncbi:MAG: Gfo/Idh/MocA family oxidoreductase [Clostridia bacterium]|nr:Gfo/Idh/MocA family oxidoreductase [Clostridia bacterium]
MSTNTKVKWGVLGTANIADYGMIPGALLAESCELHAIAGRSQEKVDRYVNKFGFNKGYIGYDKLIEDDEIQAVYVPLPNDIHKEWVIKALRAGKHVLCEKPLALNKTEAEEMYKVAKENNVILMEAYAYLHSPYVKSLQDDVNSGIIGEPLFIETAFYTQGYDEDFRLHKELGGGMVYDLGCYCTTMILSLINSDVSMVKAVAEMTDEDVDASTAAILKFKNGARAAFNCGMVLGNNARYDRLYIKGTKGYIESFVEYNQSGKLKYEITVDGTKTVREVDAPNNYSLEVENLSKCILGLSTPLVTPEFSLKNSALLDAILEEIGY